MHVKWEETSYSTCSRISVRYSETSCQGTNVWPLIGSKFAKNSWKLDKADKTKRTWPFQAKNRYDVRLANRRAPGLYLALECTCFWHQSDQVYLFLAPKWPGIPVFGKNPYYIFGAELGGDTHKAT